jgi:hypothetical protein
MGELNVYSNVSRTVSLLWTQSGNKDKMWLNARIPIQSAKSFRLSLEAVRGKAAASDIAIDDLDMIDGLSCVLNPLDAAPGDRATTAVPPTTTTQTVPVSTGFDCNFESGSCLYKTVGWTRARGSTSVTDAGPLDSDHTLGTNDGWYLYANLLNRNDNYSATIQIDGFSGPQCLEFYYYENSRFDVSLQVYQLNGDQTSIVWKLSNSEQQGRFWRLGRVGFLSQASSKFSVQFKLTGRFSQASISDAMALDDFKFQSGECSDSAALNQVCSFSTYALCNYTTEGVNFAWFLADLWQNEAGGPLSFGDHTNQGGVGSGYMYIKSSGVTKVNSTAKLTSPVYTPNIINQNRCLEFYYVIQESDTIVLNLKSFAKATPNGLTFWSQSLAHDDGAWWKVNVPVYNVDNYTLTFEAVLTRVSGNGVVALDDISLKETGDCRFESVCDFEQSDLCNWKNVKNDEKNQLKWIINAGSTPTEFTGPSFDHTLSTDRGNYVYIESSFPAVKGWRAQLASELMRDDSPSCMVFW